MKSGFFRRRSAYWLAACAIASVIASVVAWRAGLVELAVWLVFSVPIAMVLLFGAVTLFTMYSGAPYVAVNDDLLPVIVRLAGIRPGERLFDLGSGDGRILRAAARAGAKAEGWEISPYLWAWSEFAAWASGFGDSVTTKVRNYWAHSVADADIIVVYLLPSHMGRMAEKLKRELRPGSRVVSIGFVFDGWEPKASEERVHLYIV
jgi:SAM-dependent methyltransferase